VGFEIVTPEDEMLDISTFEGHAIYPTTHLFYHAQPVIDDEGFITVDYDKHGTIWSTTAGVFLSPPIDLSDYHTFEVSNVNLPGVAYAGNDSISLIAHPNFSGDTWQERFHEFLLNGYEFLASSPVQNSGYNKFGGEFDSFVLDVRGVNTVARVGFVIGRGYYLPQEYYPFGLQVGGMKMTYDAQGYRTGLSSVGGKMVNSKMMFERRRVF